MNLEDKRRGFRYWSSEVIVLSGTRGDGSKSGEGQIVTGVVHHPRRGILNDGSRSGRQERAVKRNKGSFLPHQ